MVVTNKSALGIIFPNSFDVLIPDMVNLRLMASVPFASRYRMIDFTLSSMSNCGIDNVSILPNRNYHSLMDHLGSGREWDLVRKGGGLNIFPPFAERSATLATGRIGALASLLRYLKDQKEKYVVMSDSNIVANMNFSEMIDAHIASGADITIAYNEQELPENLLHSSDTNKDFYYTFSVNQERIEKIYVNSTEVGVQNFSMNIFVIERELLCELVNTAFVRGQEHFTRDVLLPKVKELNIYGYKYTGYVARICSVKSYFDENMKLLDDDNLDALFAGAPIYTKVRDDNPTRYMSGSKVTNTMAADGCIIEGEVENSILFRGVKIEKGAKVKNCILMQDTVVKEGAIIEYLITDKEVTVSENKEMKGTDIYPIYIAKKQSV